MIKRLLKPLILLVTLAALIWGGYLLLRPDSHQLITEAQIEIMQEALLALETFNDDGDASTAVGSLNALTSEYAELLSRREKLGDGADKISSELESEIERLSGELINESFEVEISAKPKADEVAAAFEKFSNQ